MASDSAPETQAPDRREALRLLTSLVGGTAAGAMGAGQAKAVEAAPGLQVETLFSLKGKVALLTDAGGIGSREIAHLLGRAGAHVVMADRDFETAKGTAALIAKEGGSAVAMKADIESEASVVALFADVAKAAGRLDILVNCAGMLANQPLVETTVQQWDDVQSLNLRANFLCMREGVKQMLAAGHGGRIVNITTIGSRHPVMNGNEAYGAARQGVSALTRNTALDYAKNGILANTVLVGSVLDKVTTHPTTVAAQKAGRIFSGPISEGNRRPLGNGDMTDVAAAVLYLVAPASRWVTGHELVVDGGFLIS
jgi:NAD(P)-dependent dehydrogenase (short-subunit alcohol dehydrogenase family)